MVRLAPGTGQGPGESLGAGLLQVRDDPARVDALVGHLDVDHDAAGAPPRPGLRAGRGAAGDRAPIAPIGQLGLFYHLVRQRLYHGMAGPARDRTARGWRLDPLPHLGRGQVAVTAHDAEGSGPGVAQGLAKPLHHREPGRRAEARGLENRGDQAAREALRPGPRHTALAARLALVPERLLLAMGRGIGGINVEHAQLGRAGV